MHHSHMKVDVLFELAKSIHLIYHSWQVSILSMRRCEKQLMVGSTGSRESTPAGGGVIDLWISRHVTPRDQNMGMLSWSRSPFWSLSVEHWSKKVLRRYVSMSLIHFASFQNVEYFVLCVPIYVWWAPNLFLPSFLIPFQLGFFSRHCAQEKLEGTLQKL